MLTSTAGSQLICPAVTDQTQIKRELNSWDIPDPECAKQHLMSPLSVFLFFILFPSQFLPLIVPLYFPGLLTFANPLLPSTSSTHFSLLPSLFSRRENSIETALSPPEPPGKSLSLLKPNYESHLYTIEKK